MLEYRKALALEPFSFSGARCSRYALLISAFVTWEMRFRSAKRQVKCPHRYLYVVVTCRGEYHWPGTFFMGKFGV